MTKRMLIDATHAEETRVAVVEGNRLIEYDYESKVRKQLKGSIFLAKVTRVEPSLQAAFVNFGGNRHGFLPFSEIHPDYFRIPVADREALLAEQRAMLEQLAAEEEAAIAEEEAALAALERGEQPVVSEDDLSEHPPETIEEVGGKTAEDLRDQDHAQADDAQSQPEPVEAFDATYDEALSEAEAEAEEFAENLAEELDEESGEDDDTDDEDSDDDSEDEDSEVDESGDEDSEQGEDQSVNEEDNGEEGGENTAEEMPQPVRAWTYRLVTNFNEETSEFETSEEGDAFGFDLETADKLKSILSQHDDVVRLRDEKRVVGTEGEDSLEKTILWVAFRQDNEEVIESEKQNKGRRGRGRFRNRNRRGGRGGEGQKEAGRENSREGGRGRKGGKSGGRHGRSNFRSKRVELVGGDGVEGDQPFRFNLRKNYKIQEVIKRGQIMLVQVQKEERGNKGAAVTTYLSLPGRYCVLMPNSPRGGGVSRKVASFAERKRMREILKELEVPEGMSVILRTAGVARTKVEIKRDLDYLMRLWDNVRELTLQSSAPANIYEESNLVKRAVRDIYGNEVEEIWVSGDAGFKEAKNFMKMLMPSHIKRVQEYTDPKIPLFHRYQVENQIADMGEPVVTLKSGGYLVINPTEALVSVDVNSGRATKERHIEETALKTNLEAAEEVARQLRLRDLGGLVVIDFIDMEDYRNNAKVERKLKDALSTDRARIQVGRISSFGLLELSRQRLNPSLTEAQFEKCPHCKGNGVIRTVDAAAILALRALQEEGIRSRSEQVALSIPSTVAIYILNNKRDILADIERRYGFQVLIRTDEALAPAGFEVESLKNAVSAQSRGAHADHDEMDEMDEAAIHNDNIGNEAEMALDDEAEDALNNGNREAGSRNERGERGDKNKRGRGNRGGRGRNRDRQPRERNGQDAESKDGNQAAPEHAPNAQPGETTETVAPTAEPKFKAKRFSSRKSAPEQTDTTPAATVNDVQPSAPEAVQPSEAQSQPSEAQADNGPRKKGWWNRLVE